VSRLGHFVVESSLGNLAGIPIQGCEIVADFWILNSCYDHIWNNCFGIQAQGIV